MSTVPKKGVVYALFTKLSASVFSFHNDKPLICHNLYAGISPVDRYHDTVDICGMLGSKEKVALAVTARRNFCLSIPMATPARHARTIKKMLKAMTNRMTVPLMRYNGQPFSCANIRFTPLCLMIRYTISLFEGVCKHRTGRFGF